MADSPGDQSYDFAEPDPPPKPRTVVPQAAKVVAAPVAVVKAKPAVETSCAFCGLTVAGPPRARCPECAAPMDSSAADLIKFCDPVWVRRVSGGLMLMALGLAGHVGGSAMRLLRSNDVLESTVAHLLAAALLGAGVFIVSKPAPSHRPASSIGRSVARGAAVMALLLWLLLALVALVALKWVGVAELIKPLVLLVLLVQAVAAVSLGFLCGDIASNIPDDSIASHAVNGGWLVVMMCVGLVVIQGLDLTTPVHIMFFTCSFPMIAGLLVIVLFAMVTLLRLAIELRTSASEGEAIEVRRAQRAAGVGGRVGGGRGGRGGDGGGVAALGEED